MNKRAKANHKHNRSAFNNGAEHAERGFTPFKGAMCPTAFASKAANPENKKTGPRKGHKCDEPVKMTDKAHI